VGEFTWRRVVRSAIEIYVILFVIGACCPYKLIFQPHTASYGKLPGLVLESPFYTAYRVVMPIPIMPMDRFRNKDKIGKVKCPVFVIHGQSDTIIKPWHGRELFELAHEPKTNWWIAKAGHNDIIEVAGSDYPERIKEFVGMVVSNQAVSTTNHTNHTKQNGADP